MFSEYSCCEWLLCMRCSAIESWSMQFLFSFVGHCFVFFFARFITNGIYFSCCFFILFIGFFRGIFTPFLGSIVSGFYR
jgi:hypothetical protein